MKLFRVEVAYTYYCLAENEATARYYASDAASDQYLPEVADAFELTDEKELFLENGWDRNCLVYGTREDVTLGDAWDKRAGSSNAGP